MKASVGGTALFIIVISLIVIFTSVMTFTTNRSNAFAIKDQIVSVIEDNGGYESVTSYESDKITDDIVDILTTYTYRSSGKCSDIMGDLITYNRDGTQGSMENSAICIYRIKQSGGKGAIEKYYYKVEVFYSLSLPVVEQFFKFKSIGETKYLFR